MTEDAGAHTPILNGVNLCSILVICVSCNLSVTLRSRKIFDFAIFIRTSACLHTHWTKFQIPPCKFQNIWDSKKEEMVSSLLTDRQSYDVFGYLYCVHVPNRLAYPVASLRGREKSLRTDTLQTQLGMRPNSALLITAAFKFGGRCSSRTRSASFGNAKLE